MSKSKRKVKRAPGKNVSPVLKGGEGDKSAADTKPVVELAPVVPLRKPEDQEHVDALRDLLDRAEAGISTGLVFVETSNTKGKLSFITGATGVLKKRQTFCLGTIEVLKAGILKNIAS